MKRCDREECGGRLYGPDHFSKMTGHASDFVFHDPPTCAGSVGPRPTWTDEQIAVYLDRYGLD